MTDTAKTTAPSYNGWKNRQTWNVALWIQNDEPLYRVARAYARMSPRPTYRRFIDAAGIDGMTTPDGIAYNDARLDYRALTEMIRECGA